MSVNERTTRLAKGLGWFSVGLGLTGLLAPEAIASIAGVSKRRTGLIRLYGLGELAAGIAIMYVMQPSKIHKRGIHAQGTCIVNSTPEEVYQFWRNFENLPRFMRHLELVAMREAGISHWVATGPAGTTVEWDARIINEVDNKLIGWQSLEGSTISTAGSVHFDESERGTTVRVRLQYSPPAGKLGSTVAWLFGEEPSQQIREDLRRFKALLETGEIPRRC